MFVPLPGRSGRRRARPPQSAPASVEESMRSYIEQVGVQGRIAAATQTLLRDDNDGHQWLPENPFQHILSRLRVEEIAESLFVDEGRDRTWYQNLVRQANKLAIESRVIQDALSMVEGGHGPNYVTAWKREEFALSVVEGAPHICGLRHFTKVVDAGVVLRLEALCAAIDEILQRSRVTEIDSGRPGGGGGGSFFPSEGEQERKAEGEDGGAGSHTMERWISVAAPAIFAGTLVHPVAAQSTIAMFIEIAIAGTSFERAMDMFISAILEEASAADACAHAHCFGIRLQEPPKSDDGAEAGKATNWTYADIMKSRDLFVSALKNLVIQKGEVCVDLLVTVPAHFEGLAPDPRAAPATNVQSPRTDGVQELVTGASAGGAGADGGGVEPDGFVEQRVLRVRREFSLHFLQRKGKAEGVRHGRGRAAAASNSDPAIVKKILSFTSEPMKCLASGLFLRVRGAAKYTQTQIHNLIGEAVADRLKAEEARKSRKSKKSSGIFPVPPRRDRCTLEKPLNRSEWRFMREAVKLADQSDYFGAFIALIPLCLLQWQARGLADIARVCAGPAGAARGLLEQGRVLLKLLEVLVDRVSEGDSDEARRIAKAEADAAFAELETKLLKDHKKRKKKRARDKKAAYNDGDMQRIATLEELEAEDEDEWEQMKDLADMRRQQVYLDVLARTPGTLSFWVRREGRSLRLALISHFWSWQRQVKALMDAGEHSDVLAISTHLMGVLEELLTVKDLRLGKGARGEDESMMMSIGPSGDAPEGDAGDDEDEDEDEEALPASGRLKLPPLPTLEEDARRWIDAANEASEGLTTVVALLRSVELSLALDSVRVCESAEVANLVRQRESHRKSDDAIFSTIFADPTLAGAAMLSAGAAAHHLRERRRHHKGTMGFVGSSLSAAGTVRAARATLAGMRDAFGKLDEAPEIEEKRREDANRGMFSGRKSDDHAHFTDAFHTRQGLGNLREGLYPADEDLFALQPVVDLGRARELELLRTTTTLPAFATETAFLRYIVENRVDSALEAAIIDMASGAKVRNVYPMLVMALVPWAIRQQAWRESDTAVKMRLRLDTHDLRRALEKLDRKALPPPPQMDGARVAERRRNWRGIMERHLEAIVTKLQPTPKIRNTHCKLIKSGAKRRVFHARIVLEPPEVPATKKHRIYGGWSAVFAADAEIANQLLENLPRLIPESALRTIEDVSSGSSFDLESSLGLVTEANVMGRFGIPFAIPEVRARWDVRITQTDGPKNQRARAAFADLVLSGVISIANSGTSLVGLAVGADADRFAHGKVFLSAKGLRRKKEKEHMRRVLAKHWDKTICVHLYMAVPFPSQFPDRLRPAHVEKEPASGHFTILVPAVIYVQLQHATGIVGDAHTVEESSTGILYETLYANILEAKHAFDAAGITKQVPNTGRRGPALGNIRQSKRARAAKEGPGSDDESVEAAERFDESWARAYAGYVRVLVEKIEAHARHGRWLKAFECAIKVLLAKQASIPTHLSVDEAALPSAPIQAPDGWPFADVHLSEDETAMKALLEFSRILQSDAKVAEASIALLDSLAAAIVFYGLAAGEDISALEAAGLGRAGRHLAALPAESVHWTGYALLMAIDRIVFSSSRLHLDGAARYLLLLSQKIHRDIEGLFGGGSGGGKDDGGARRRRLANQLVEAKGLIEAMEAAAEEDLRVTCTGIASFMVAELGVAM